MYEDPPPPSIIETYRSSRRQSRRATLTPPLSPFDLEGVPLVSSQNEKYLQVDSGQMQSRAPSRSDSLFDRIFPPLAPRSDTDRSSRYDAGSGIPSSQSHRTHVQLGALPVVLSRSVDASRVPEVTLRNTEPLSPPLPVVRTHTPSRTIHPHPPPSDRRGEERRQSRHRRESAKVYTLNISPPTQPSIPSPQLVSSPASRQTIVQDSKSLIAYSSISHMGVVVLGLFSNSIQGIEGALLLSLAHGFVSPALFIYVGGVLYERTGTRNFVYIRGLVHFMPVGTILFFIFTLCNTGIPLSLNFLGEQMSLIGIWDRSPIIAVLGSTGIVLSACYSIFFYNRISYGSVSPHMKNTLLDIREIEYTSLISLLIPTLLLGILPNIILNKVHFSVTTLLSVY